MRDAQITSAKATLRSWFAAQDAAYLARVVIECRVGIFRYSDDCHCLRALVDGGYDATGNNRAAEQAELALYLLGGGRVTVFRGQLFRDDAFEVDKNYMGRVRTLPIVLAEISRRERQQAAEVQNEKVSA